MHEGGRTGARTKTETETETETEAEIETETEIEAETAEEATARESTEHGRARGPDGKGKVLKSERRRDERKKDMKHLLVLKFEDSYICISLYYYLLCKFLKKTSPTQHPQQGSKSIRCSLQPTMYVLVTNQVSFNHTTPHQLDTGVT
jgi:hypothetical protein